MSLVIRSGGCAHPTNFSADRATEPSTAAAVVDRASRGRGGMDGDRAGEMAAVRPGGRQAAIDRDAEAVLVRSGWSAYPTNQAIDQATHFSAAGAVDRAACPASIRPGGGDVVRDRSPLRLGIIVFAKVVQRVQASKKEVCAQLHLEWTMPALC